MKDGSFQVLRRLVQDVPGWWAQMRQAAAHNVEGGEDRLAAKAVGRWRSGTPLAAAPNTDNPSAHAGSDDNDFEYDDDPQGLKTPRFAHIRKTYPRDDQFQDDQHRIMRRGIPFGRHFDPALGRGHGQDAERGLLYEREDHAPYEGLHGTTGLQAVRPHHRRPVRVRSFEEDAARAGLRRFVAIAPEGELHAPDYVMGNLGESRRRDAQAASATPRRRPARAEGRGTGNALPS